MKLFKWSFHYKALNNKDLLQLCPLYRLLWTPSLDQSTLSLRGFLLPWRWGISSGFLQQSAAAAPYLDDWYLRTATPPDLERGRAPLALRRPCSQRSLDMGLPLPDAAPGLGLGSSSRPPPLASDWVAPPGRRPWPLTRGSSSRPPPPTADAGKLLPALTAPSPPGTLGRCPRPLIWGNSSSLPPLGNGVLQASALDLGRGVAPLGHALRAVAAARALRAVPAIKECDLKCEVKWKHHLNK